MHRVTQIVEPNGAKTIHVYDSNNQVILQKKEAQTVVFVYDANGNLLKTKYPDQMGNMIETTILERDGISLVETDLKKRTIRYTYTDHGAIYQVNAGSKDVETYEYNKDGSLASITYPSEKRLPINTIRMEI